MVIVKALDRERVQVLAAGLPSAVAGNVVVAALTIWVLAGAVPADRLVAWSLAIGTALLLRLSLLIVLRAKSLDASRALRLLRAATLLTGTAWGLLPVFLFPVDPLRQAFLPFVAAGITGAAVAALAIDRRSVLLFVLPVLLPLIARLFITGGEIPTTMGLLVLAFMIFLGIAALRNERVFKDIERLRIQGKEQNTALRAAQELARLGNWSLDIASGEAVWSDTIFTLFGRDPASFRPSLSVYMDEITHPDDRAAVQEKLAEAMRNPGQQHSIEHRIIRTDGNYRWMRVEGMVSTDDSGKPAHMLGTVQDITARKHAEIALRASESRLSFMLKTSPVVIYTCKAEPGFPATYVSPNIRELFGFDPAQSLTTPGWWASGIHPEDAPRVFAGFEGVLDRDEYSHEYRFRMADGQYRWIHDSLRVVRDAGGRPREIIGYWADIHERRQIEQAMHESEQRFRYMLETCPTAARVARAGGREVIFSNQRYAELINVSASETIGQNPASYYANPADYAEILQRLKQGETIFDRLVELQIPDAGTKWALASYLPVTYEGESVVLGWFYDITERKRAEQALRQSEARLKIAQRIARMGYFHSNLKTRQIEWSDEVYEILGYVPGEIAASFEIFASRIHPDDREQVLATVGKAYSDSYRPDPDGRAQLPEIEHRIQRRDGTVLWVRSEAQAELDAAGHPTVVQGTVQDITERREAEEALNRFKRTLDDTLDMIFMFDPESLRFVYVNRGAVESMGYTREELLALTPCRIKPKMTESVFRERIAPLLSGEKSVISFESVHRRKDGSDFPVDISLQLVREPGRRGVFVAMVRDITERKKMEQLKSEFVSTVSHELRTPLTSIRGSLGLLIGGVVDAQPDKARELMQIASQNAERLSLLINDILDIEKIASNRMTFDMVRQPVMPLVEQAIKANQDYALQYRVSLLIAERLEGGEIVVDTIRFQQVLANLLSNAAKFSPPNSAVLISVSAVDNTCRISVKDHGPGIPEHFRTRLFEKFSQADTSDTRVKGGTGLGLAISRDIVEHMGGRIQCTSVPGSGAEFFVEFELHRQDQPTLPVLESHVQ